MTFPIITDFDDDARDGVLFRFWIRMASSRPSKVVQALGRCVTVEQYREALTKLAESEGVNLP